MRLRTEIVLCPKTKAIKMFSLGLTQVSFKGCHSIKTRFGNNSEKENNFVLISVQTECAVVMK